MAVDDSLPPIYGRIYACADPIGGAVTLASLQRVLQAGEIKASEVEKVRERAHCIGKGSSGSS